MTKALELAKFGREAAPVGIIVGDSDTQTLSAKTFSDGPVFSNATVNGVPYLNASRVFSTTNTLVFDGTNLGVGISTPAQKLHISGGNIRVSSASEATIITNGGNFTTGSVADSAITKASGASLLFGTGSTEQLRLDAVGNLGLAATPSTWVSSENVLQIGALAALTSRSVGNANRQVSLYNNSYVDAAGTSRYLISDSASFYRQNSGWHYWFTAPTGIAGAAVTFNQAMTLDSTGNLLIGTASNSGHRLQVVSAPGSVQMRWSDASNSTGYLDTVVGASRIYTNTNLVFATGDPSSTVTERARIDSSGNLLVGTTSIASGYIFQAQGWGRFRHPSGDALLSIVAGNTTGSSLLYFGDTANDGMGQIGYNHTSDTMYFITNGSERARINAAGNFLVGKPNDDGGYKFDVYGDAHVGLGSENRGLYIGPIGYTASIRYNGNGNLDIAPRAGYSIAFLTETGGTERVRITNSGSVGIGTSAPGANSKLDVIGNITIDSAFSSQYGLCFRRGFEDSDNLRIYSGDTGQGRVGGLRLSGYDGIAFGTGSNSWQERMRIDINGRVSCNSELVATGNFRVYSGGGEYAYLGNVWKSDSSHNYIHVKTSLSMYSYKMTMFRVVGYESYSSYAESYLGCYTYGEYPTNTMAGAEPYGKLLANQGIRPAATDIYYSADGYVCLLLNWPSYYTGLAVHYIASGGTHGLMTDIKVLAFTSNNSTGKAY